MRVLQVIHGWPPETAGGTGVHVGALCTALQARGHELAVLTSHVGPGRLPNVPLLALPSRTPQCWEDTWRSAASLAHFRQAVQRWRPDVLHIHHLSGLPLGVARVAHDLGVRVVLTLHDYALPCPRGQLVDATLRPCPGPEPARCATCLGAHLRLAPTSRAIGAFLSRWPALRARAREAMDHPRPGDAPRVAARQEAVRALLQQVDVLLSPSHDLAARFRELGLGEPRHLALPLPRPIHRAPDPPPGPVRLLFMGAIIPTKGPDRLLHAFRRLPAGAATLTLAGPTPPFDGQPRFADELHALAEATPGVRWSGPIPHAEVGALLAAHDVLVLPSTWPENSPLSVREAAAAGLRVIIPAQGGAKELVPEARRVAPDEDLSPALIEELRAGRRHNPPRTWPTPDEHARALEALYRP